MQQRGIKAETVEFFLSVERRSTPPWRDHTYFDKQSRQRLHDRLAGAA